MTAIATKKFNKPPKTMLEVFMSLPEGTLVQLIKNQLVMSPSPSFIHQKVLASLFNKMYVQVEKDKSGILLVAPFNVYLDRKNAFQPDIIFIAKENISRIKDNGL